jgi:hypothetical protein
LPNVASQTEGDTTVSTTEEIRPMKPPITAPRVVQQVARVRPTAAPGEREVSV